MLTVLFGTLFDGLPLIPIAVAFVWTLRFQKYADISLAGSFSISSACVAYLMSSGISVSFSIAIGLIVGLVVGSLMGFAINWLQIEPLIAGLIILFISYALSIGITQGTIPIRTTSNPLVALFAMEINWGFRSGFHPATNLLFFTVAALSVYATSLLLRSEWGCAFRALEDLKGGRHFLESLGISPATLSCSGFALAGILASVSGILVALRDQQTTSSLGLDVLIDIIPAYLLGVTLLERRPTLSTNQNLEGTRTASFLKSLFHALRSFSPASSAAIGVMMFFLVINVVQQITPFPWLPRVMMGLILLSLLGLPSGMEAWRRKVRERDSTSVATAEAPLCINGLSVTYPTWNGNNSILRNVNVIGSPGETIQINGPNGAGKSSFMKALVGHIESIGNFTIPSKQKRVPRTGRAALLGYVAQDVDQCIAVTLSVAENATLSLRGSKLSIFHKWNRSSKQAFGQLHLDDINLNPNSLVAWLSGGQKRRLAISLIALKTPSPVVIALDEPFGDLDANGKKRCADFLASLAEKGNILLLIDHQNYILPTREIDDIGVAQSYSRSSIDSSKGGFFKRS